MTVVSYNMMKGRQVGTGRVITDRMATALVGLEPDILMLQEYPGPESEGRFPRGSLAQRFQDAGLGHHIYGQNAIYPRGSHGNAIFSRFPIVVSTNTPLSQTPFAHRGLLQCQVQWSESVQVSLYCTHLDLMQGARDRQLIQLRENIPSSETLKGPLVLAGDFNDWNGRLDPDLRAWVGVGSPTLKTFPSFAPIWALDRIYCRGFQLTSSQVLSGAPWRGLSDHLPVMTTLLMSDA